MSPSSSESSPTRTNILSLPPELLNQILRSLNSTDSLCFGLAHPILYNLHFALHGPVSLLSGSTYAHKKNAKYGLQVHVRLSQWLRERDLRIIVVPKNDDPGAKTAMGKPGRYILVSEEEYVRAEEKYLGKLGYERKVADSKNSIAATVFGKQATTIEKEKEEKTIIVTETINGKAQRLEEAKRSYRGSEPSLVPAHLRVGDEEWKTKHEMLRHIQAARGGLWGRMMEFVDKAFAKKQ